MQQLSFIVDAECLVRERLHDRTQKARGHANAPFIFDKSRSALLDHLALVGGSHYHLSAYSFDLDGCQIRNAITISNGACDRNGALHLCLIDRKSHFFFLSSVGWLLLIYATLPSM